MQSIHRTFVRAATGVLLVLCASSALAQGGRQKIGDNFEPTFILNANGEWSDAQDRAVRDAGGTVTFRHPASGIGAVVSPIEGFLERVLASGAFNGGAEDALTPFGAASAATPDDVLGAPVHE